MPATKAYKDMNLEELSERGAVLRADLAALDEGTRSDEHAAKMTALLDEVARYDGHFTLARLRDQFEADQRSAQERHEAIAAARAELAPRGALGVHGLAGQRSIGAAIMDHADMKSWLEHGMRSAGSPDIAALRVEVEGLAAFADGVRAPVTEFGSGGPGNAGTGNVNALLPVGQPIAPTPRMARLTVRDLIPSQPTQLSVIPYVRELNPTASESAATAVAEAGTKPDGSLNFQGATATPTVVAVGLSPSKQLWEDAPLVAAYINQRLPYLVKFQEQNELLNGSGTWPDIQGILGISGKQTQSATAGEFAITIGMAIAKIENVDGAASGVSLNPTDAWSMFTKRAAGGSGAFDAGNPFSMDAVNALTVWGLPTVRSRVHAQGQAVVADWARGAMILDRNQVVVEIFPQHSDYASKNLIYVRCEERIGLAVWRPDFFVVTTLG